jgi:hypothetical protein
MPAVSKKTSKLKAKTKAQAQARHKKVTQKRRANASSEEEASEEELHRPCRKRSKLSMDSDVEEDGDIPESIRSDVEVEVISSDSDDPNLEVGSSVDLRKLGD